MLALHGYMLTLSSVSLAVAVVTVPGETPTVFQWETVNMEAGGGQCRNPAASALSFAQESSEA